MVNDRNRLHQCKNNQKNKKKKKGQNFAEVQQQQAQQPKDILTFGNFEEHKASSAQAFISKKAEQRSAKDLSSFNDQIKGKKLKKQSQNSKTKQEFSQSNSQKNANQKISIQDLNDSRSEEDDEPAWVTQQITAEALTALYDSHLSVIENPTETTPGIFQILIQPNCGVETAGCHIEIKLSYQSTHSMAMVFEVLPETAVGLTIEQVQQLSNEIKAREEEEEEDNRDLYTIIISTVEEFLSSLNSSTKIVIQKQAAEEEKQRQVERIEEAVKQRKKILRLHQDFEKKQFLKFQEERKWCHSLADQQKFSNQRPSNRQNSQLNVDKDKKQQYQSVISGGTGSDTGADRKRTDGTAILDQFNQISRYSNDFEQLEEIGRGGFGIVYKAQHKLDGNIYAIKMIKLQRNNEDNKRILREIKYLSGLNNQYIVRYFQTWVEHETDPEIIQNFDDWDESEEESGSNSDSFELTVTTEDDGVSARRAVGRRTSSHQNRNPLVHQQPSAQPSFLQKLRADNFDANGEGKFVGRQRVHSDVISLTPDPKMNHKKAPADEEEKAAKQLSAFDFSDEDDEELLLAHEQDQNFFYDRIDEEESKLSQSNPDDSNFGKLRKQSSEDGIKILYIQMQYCEGETLENFLQQNPGAQNEKLKWKIYRQILEAVNYLHQRDIIHRDIKPENIFLDTKKNARLGDFGLAKRINKQQLKNAEVMKAGETDNPVHVKDFSPQHSLTTGLGTVRFAAPEQYTKDRKAIQTSYGFKADIYSLGIVLLDMFRDHNISLKELNDIHEAVTKEKVLAIVAKSMPPEAVSLIEKMIKRQPSQRPTLLEVLTSADLPQDEILESLLNHLQNHKSAVKLQLFQHLCRLTIPKALSLQYHGSLRDELRLFNTLTQQQVNPDQQSLSPQMKQKQRRFNKDLQSRKKRKAQVEKHLEHEALAKKVRREVVADLGRIFEQYGASSLMELPVIAPVIDERTIFLSKAIRILPWLKDLRDEIKNTDFNLHEKLCSIMGSKNYSERTRLLTDDYLVLDGEDQQCHELDDTQMDQTGSSLKVKPLFDLGPPLDGGGSCWQELILRKLPELLSQKSACRLLDQFGIVVCLQPQLIDSIAQYVAQNRFNFLQKVFHIGRTYVANSHAKVSMLRERKRLAPKGVTQACLAIINPNLKSRKQTQTLSEMSQEELLLEVELIRTIDSYFTQSRLSNRYEIRISSSELLDAIFDECSVDLADRIQLLQLLYDQQASNCQQSYSSSNVNQISNQQAIRKEINKYASRGVNVLKLSELMQIRGSLDHVNKQWQRVQHIQCKQRFKQIMSYFGRLESMFNRFDEICTESSSTSAVAPEDEKQFETKKEQQAQRLACYPSSLKNKVRSRDKDISASNQKNFLKKASQVSQIFTNDMRPKLVFDFGLLLEQSAIHYAGLLCCVSVKHARKKLGKTGQTHDEILAYGGRFDNNVANFQQFEVKKYIPACAEVTFNCSEIAAQIIEHDSLDNSGKLYESDCTIDFCISSSGEPLIDQKIQMMHALQLEGFRVHVDYSSAVVSDQFITENNVHYLIRVLDETGKLRLTDRFGLLTPSSGGEVFEKAKHLISAIKNAHKV